MYTVYSFDVFDTCLTRTCARPTDVFTMAALRLRAAQKADFPLTDVHDVVRLRTEAETAARKALQGREDLTLPEIYACLPAGNPFGIVPADFLDAELEAEASCLRPVAALRDDIRALRMAGRRIVFVTDMFLPMEFIRDQLAAHGFFQPGDGLYVSGEIGLCKWSGGLYRHVLEQEGVAARQVLHVGDNPQSDVVMARRAGMAARLLAPAVLSARESALARPLPDHDPGAGLLAGSCRAARCFLPREASGGVAAVAASVAAPLFLSFTAWVLAEAARAGLPRLHFVSRDGQIFYRIARILCRDRPGLPEPRYIHGSRQAWFFPSVTRCARDGLGWLLVPGHSRRPADLLAKLDMQPGDLPELGPDMAPGSGYWAAPLPPGAEAAFWDMLERPANARAVEARAAQARRLTADYFRPLVRDLPTLALVDLGWTLKTQVALGGVLRASGLPCEVFGYYFGVSASRAAGQEGRYRAFLTELPRHLDPAETLNPVFRNANLLEQCFSLADHGQVTGYAREGEDVVPRLRQARADQIGMAATVQQAILDVAAAWSREALAAGMGLETLASCKSGAVANAVSFLSAPTLQEAWALRTVMVGDDQNESRRRALVRPLGPGDLCRAVLSGRGTLPAGDYARSFDWIEGSVALSPRWLAPLLRTRRVFRLLRSLRIRF